MRAPLVAVAVALAALAGLAPRLPRVREAVAVPPNADASAGVWDVLGGELRSTLAAITLLQVEHIRHRGVYYLHEDPVPPPMQGEAAAVVASLRPADLPDPEDQTWAVHSHFNGLFTHLHAYGARKHKHNVVVEQFHAHPELHLSHSHRTDPDIPHWHDEGAWTENVEHRHGTLVHAHRLGIWPHTHPGMENLPFELIHDEDKARLAKLQAEMSGQDPESAFSVESAVQPEKHAHAEQHAGGAEHGQFEEMEHHHGGTAVLAKEKDWRGLFGDMEREIQPYSTTHEAPDATGALSTLPWYKIGVVIDPHFIQGWNLGAAALRRDYGQVEPAIAFLKEGLEKNPGNPELLVLLGRAYLFGRKDTAAAAETLAQAARSAQAGLAAKRYANPFEAKRWETAWVDSVRMLTTIHAREGRIQQAIATARQGLADFPDDPVLQETLDTLLLQQQPAAPR